MTGQQRKMLGFLVMAVVVGAMFLGVRSSRQKAADLRRQQEQSNQLQEAKQRKRTVVFAREQIKKRSEIKKEWLEVKEVEERDVPKLEHATALDQVVGRVALVDIYHGEPLVRARFTDKDQITALSFVIEKGKRAVSVQINTVDACGGFLKQGDRVDILGTFMIDEYGDGRGEGGKVSVTATMMTNVKVLAIDKVYELDQAERSAAAGAATTSGSPPPPPTRAPRAKTPEEQKGNNPYLARANITFVTFEVTPKDAERLILAGQTATTLKLLLRSDAGPLDKAGGAPRDKDTDRVAVTQGSITGGSEDGSAVPGGDQKQVKIEIIRAGQKGERFLHVNPADKAGELASEGAPAPEEPSRGGPQPEVELPSDVSAGGGEGVEMPE